MYFNGGKKIQFEDILERAPDQIGKWLGKKKVMPKLS